MAKKEQDKGYSEEIKHVQATRPEPWPGIQGRSEEHEAEPETERSAEGGEGRRSDSTEAQRELEREMHTRR